MPNAVAPQFPLSSRSEKGGIASTLTTPRHLETARAVAGLGYADGFMGETAAAYAARQAAAKVMGAAGKSAPVGGATVRDATLHIPFEPSAVSLTPRGGHSAPYAFDYYTDGTPLDKENEAAAVVQLRPKPPGAMRTRAPAPYSTLAAEELEALHERESRYGPQLWRPGTAAGLVAQRPTPDDAPAGFVIAHGDVDGSCVPRSATWIDPAQTRPVSRRGPGSARPSTASQFTFGWA